MKPPILLTVKDFGGDTAFLLAWAAKRIPHVGAAGFGENSVPVAVVKGTPSDARLLAVVVFNSWNKDAKSIQISCAADNPMWAHPDTIRALLRMPFVDWECFSIWMAIPYDNDRAIRFNRDGLEMKQSGPIPHVFGENRHAMIMTMTRHKWARRWRVSDEGKGRGLGASAA